LLCDRYRGSLVAYFASRIGYGDAAEDLTQEVLLKVWRNCRRMTPLAPFDRYLFRAAENRFRDYVRAQQRQFLSTTLPDETQLPSPVHTPEREVLQRHEAARIRRAVRNLSPSLRDVFVRARILGQRYREIAAELDLPVGTVKWRMSEAVRRLKQELTKEVNETWIASK